MISKQDILERAREWQLRAEVVEKDYVLGWLLAAIARHEETAEGWVLKGGTCVKKCFFETYRFSEDLDFSLLPGAEYSESLLKGVLGGITEIASELSGIGFDPAALSIRARIDKLGRQTFEGKVGYRGPLAIPGSPRVLFDLTQYEPVIDEPVLRRILHPYPDALPEDALVQTYSIEELIAEKTRALYERSRPRDLYDVVYIAGGDDHGIQLAHAREIFVDKCAAKGIPIPSSRELLHVLETAEELRSEWKNMLDHQLPQLPPLDGFFGRLPDVLGWIDLVPAAAVVTPPALPTGAAEAEVVSQSARVWGAAVPLESIRFAGANRLLVQFVYSGKRRTLEPYSLRRSSRSNLLLYAWELETAQIKAFDVSKISQLSTTIRTFTPRYRVEFAPSGALDASTQVIPSVRVVRRRAARPRSRARNYVFTCNVCHREFRHRRNDSTLRRHKSPGENWYCPGTRGSLSRIE